MLRPDRRALLRTGLALGTDALLAQSAQAAGAHAQPAPWTGPVTFSEDFNNLDVTAWGPGSRWIAHTPWAGDFGDAAFMDPQPGVPFAVKDGVLAIEARKGADGRWRSGLLSSTDAKGNGFSQRYGYFETRMKLPKGPGVWPAFWLASVPGLGDGVEIDVFEYYGVAPSRFSSAWHVWPGDKTRKPRNALTWTHTRRPIPETWHTFGVEVSPKTLKFYFDRHMVQTMPCPPEHDRPLGLLLNLALGSGWPVDKTRNPSRLLVDYVRVHAPTASERDR